MPRKNPTSAQKQRLLEANAFRCCVCKRKNVGLHFHHIDNDSSNTVDENLAVLCVEDHDVHHRPKEYRNRFNHIELGAQKLLQYKKSWESFVSEAIKENPHVLATLSSFGTEELIHSLQLVLQWPDERIEYTRSFHLLDGDLDKLTDEVFKEISSIGEGIKLAVINEPLPVEYCPCCNVGLSRTLKPAVVARLTDPEWNEKSLCSIYINPEQPSLAIAFFLRGNLILSGHLHLCQGKYLHYHCEGIDEKISITKRPSIRTQVTNIVSHILHEWNPAKVLIGTGNPDKPVLIKDLKLPKSWESKYVL